MSFSHPFGEHNVRGTLNNWFAAQITASGQPAWMPSARVLFNRPERGLISGYSGHAFTVEHTDTTPIAQYEGRNTIGGSAGEMRQGLMLINCWVSREQAPADYMRRVQQMGDMVSYLYQHTKAVELLNTYTSTAAPSGMGALVRLSNLEGQTPMPDPNPDLVRRRYLIRYIWTERT
jgi:hypothetical protein